MLSSIDSGPPALERSTRDLRRSRPRTAQRSRPPLGAEIISLRGAHPRGVSDPPASSGRRALLSRKSAHGSSGADSLGPQILSLLPPLGFDTGPTPGGSGSGE